MNKFNTFSILFLLNFTSLAYSDLLDLSLVNNLVDEINGLTGGIWKAEVTKLSLLPANEQMKPCGAKIPEKGNDTEAEPPHFEGTSSGDCTTKIDFDARTKWPSCAPILIIFKIKGIVAVVGLYRLLLPIQTVIVLHDQIFCS